MHQQESDFRPNGVNHSMPNDSTVFRAKNPHSASSVVTFRWDSNVDVDSRGEPDRYREAV